MTFTNATPWKSSPRLLLLSIAVATALSHTTWRVLLNNFAVETIGMNGAQVGLLQSVREVPGLLGVGVILLLWLCLEQRLITVTLLVLGVGTAVTGFFPSQAGLVCTTLLMSFGFHYSQALELSLTLQLTSKERVPRMLGQMVSADAAASLVIFIVVMGLFYFGLLHYRGIYIVGGCATILVVLFIFLTFPQFQPQSIQRQRFILRRRYWLYYVLTFLSGARRQIFVVFAGFLMVEKFHFSLTQMVLLFLVTQVISMCCGHLTGKFVARMGERRALLLEHAGLIAVFLGYALTRHAVVAAGLFVIDNLFFAMAIALKSYFKKIADPADISSTSGVSSTINHIAAVIIPVTFGSLWMISPSLVFGIGAGLAALAFVFALAVPHDARPGEEHIFNVPSFFSPTPPNISATSASAQCESGPGVFPRR